MIIIYIHDATYKFRSAHDLDLLYVYKHIITHSYINMILYNNSDTCCVLCMVQVPRVLTVAGSDSGGGAGIQADLKTYQARGVFGTSAISALTAQNTKGVRGVHTVPTQHLSDQMEAVLSDIGADVVKTGMLPTAEVGC